MVCFLYITFSTFQANFSKYEIKEVIKGSALVSQQLSTTVIFGLIWFGAVTETFSAVFLIAMAISMAVFGFIVRLLTGGFSFGGEIFLVA